MVVAKSWSSNNQAICTKTHKRHKPYGHKKKSKSNAEFKTLEGRKREVYVEKNQTTTAEYEREIDGAIDTTTLQTQPPRKVQRNSKKFSAQNLEYNAVDNDASTIKDIHKITDTTDIENKKKYRSKVLNGNKYKPDNFEVLQFKKELIRTPSGYSEKSDSDNWMPKLSRLVPPSPGEIQDESKYMALAKEVAEGKKLAEKKIKVQDPSEPTTLVGEQTAKKSDKKLYNFFVDLLETTFSVYNVKDKYDAEPPPISAVSSNIALEIDESVVRKLNVSTEMHDDSLQKDLRNESQILRDFNILNNLKFTTDHNREMLPVSAGKNNGRKIKLKNISPPKIRGPIAAGERPLSYKKKQKNNLLNLLKEELRMDNVYFEEPRNLYQALKIMAKNTIKSKPRKAIRFDKTMKNTEEPVQCIMKSGRRPVLCKPCYNNTKNFKTDGEKRNRGLIAKKISEPTKRREMMAICPRLLSNHSLEVYDYESLDPQHKEKIKKIAKAKTRIQPELYYNFYSSSSSEDEEEFIKVDIRNKYGFNERNNYTVRSESGSRY